MEDVLLSRSEGAASKTVIKTTAVAIVAATGLATTLPNAAAADVRTPQVTTESIAVAFDLMGRSHVKGMNVAMLVPSDMKPNKLRLSPNTNCCCCGPG